MARLLGFLGNRPDLGARAVARDAAAFTVRRAPGEHGSTSWGVGFHQGGEVLLRRRPFDERTTLSLAELLHDVRADVLVAHVRTATVGTLRAENTHPFRYRQWLFAQTGTVPAFEALRDRFGESLPQFLARDVRGDTDAELVFYLFLSFLHDGGWLDRPDVPASIARDALRSALSLVDRLAAEEGAGPAELNLVVACGAYVIGVRRRPSRMGVVVVEGRAALERLYEGEAFSRTRVPHLVDARLTLVASDFDDDRLPPGYVEVPRGFVTASLGQPPAVEPF
jgi:glutamine amidotransferase